MATYTIIGGDQKEYGPVSEADIRQWIRENRLNVQSLVKSDADSAWRTLGSFTEFAELFAAAAPAPAPIAPLAAVAPRLDETDWQAHVIERVPELKLGECLAAGWSFLGANAGFVVGAVLLTWVANCFLVVISVVVPVLGPLAYLCFSGVIMGGFYLACLRQMRGENPSPTDVFAGFKIAFAQLLLAGLVSTLLTEVSVCCFILPAIYLGVAWVFAVPLVADKKMFFWSAMELSRKVVTRAWFEVFALVLIAFLPVVIFGIFNLVHTGGYFMGLYNESNQNPQQLAQLFQSRMGDFQKLTVKMTLIGQGVLLVNLFYCAGVMMRAYENLFGARKP
jgi:hypothetical protein